MLLHPVNHRDHFVFLGPGATRRFELMSVLLFGAMGWLYFAELRAKK